MCIRDRSTWAPVRRRKNLSYTKLFERKMSRYAQLSGTTPRAGTSISSRRQIETAGTLRTSGFKISDPLFSPSEQFTSHADLANFIRISDLVDVKKAIRR
eukprot:TRINITY_DN4473_c0_g1_i6.p1 TRINITY_DN4473_c0_g1~~TRINITY_DN4473_c0_g1_i6.p1  ORF type:complete len:100 (+),score=21.61 TRINITY_DN4473_c0_g1_i6:65-364(+)